MNLHAIIQFLSEIRVGAKEERSHSAKKTAPLETKQSAQATALSMQMSGEFGDKAISPAEFRCRRRRFVLAWRAGGDTCVAMSSHPGDRDRRPWFIHGGSNFRRRRRRKWWRTWMRWLDVLRQHVSHLIIDPFPLPSPFLFQSSQNSRQNSLPPH